MDEIINHLAIFVSRLWQIHIFAEGNTRTTAIFFIKYLRTLGFNVTNEIFADNAWYFRNALVRANYTDLKKNIHETTEYLELFLRNLLLNENNELHNRSMHISGMWNEKNLDIETEKLDIEKIIREKTEGLSSKRKEYIRSIFEVVGFEKIFGRQEVIKITGLTPSTASELIKNLKLLEIIEPVSGFGKGKYKFCNR